MSVIAIFRPNAVQEELNAGKDTVLAMGTGTFFSR